MFAVTFAPARFMGRVDRLDEEKFRRTIQGRLNPKMSHAAWQSRQKAWGRLFGASSLVFFGAGCVLLAAAGIVSLTR